MNLRQAIEAGIERAPEHIQGDLLYRHPDDGTYASCAMGAAYLGCHPDADLEALIRSTRLIDEWVDQLDDRIGEIRRENTTNGVYDTVFSEVVFEINDHPETVEPWETTLEKLAQIRGPDETPLTDLEVC